MDHHERNTIRVEDRTLRQGFTRIPNEVLRREGLSPGAKLTYMGLLSYAWQEGSCFPGQERLAQDLGIGTRSVSRYLKELQRSGLLEVRRRGLGKTNIYVLPKGDAQAGNDKPTPSGRSGSAKLADQETPKDDTPDLPNWRREEDPGEEDTVDSKSRKGRTKKAQDSRRRKARSLISNRASDTGSGNSVQAIGDYLKGRPRTPRARKNSSASDREIVEAYMRSMALELRDQAPLRSTVTRLLRIYERSKLDSITGFIDVLYRAKATTLDQLSSIRGGEPGRRKVMPYFIAVVEDLVGLRDAKRPKAANVEDAAVGTR